MAQDNFEIEILPNGTIKIITDKVSMPNHANAEEFLRFMEELAGTKQKRTRKAGVHHHHHHHQQLGHGPGAGGDHGHSHSHGDHSHSHD